PAAELPALAPVLDSEMRAAGPRGARTIGGGDFFVSYPTPALEASEILIGARFPLLPARTGWSVTEVARRHGDFALAGVMTTITLDDGGGAGGGPPGCFCPAAPAPPAR